MMLHQQSPNAAAMHILEVLCATRESSKHSESSNGHVSVRVSKVTVTRQYRSHNGLPSYLT